MMSGIFIVRAKIEACEFWVPLRRTKPKILERSMATVCEGCKSSATITTLSVKVTASPPRTMRAIREVTSLMSAARSRI